MWCRLLLSFLLAAGAQAFTPTPLRWGGAPARGFVLAPRALPNRVTVSSMAGDSQKLTIWDAKSHGLSRDEIPNFAPQTDQTIAWVSTDQCIEASGDQNGDVVSVKRCTGAPTQKWEFLPWSGGTQIQLKGTQKCIEVNENEGGLNGATVMLGDCEGKLSQSWDFEEITLPSNNPSTPSLTHVTMFFLSMLALGAVSLSAWMWRMRKSARAALSMVQDVLPSNMEQGVSMAESLVRRQDEQMVPAVMFVPSFPEVSGDFSNQDVYGGFEFWKAVPAKYQNEVMKNTAYQSARIRWGGEAVFAILDKDVEQVKTCIEKFPELAFVLKDGEPKHWTDDAVLKITSWITDDIKHVESEVFSRVPEMAKNQSHMDFVQAGRREALAVAAGMVGMAGVPTVALAAAETTPWSTKDFLDAVENDKVEKVQFATGGNQVLVVDTEGNRYNANLLPGESAEVIKLLQKKDILFNVAPPENNDGGPGGFIFGLLANSASFIIPFLILGFFLTRGQGGGGGGMGGDPMGVGKSKSKIEMEPQTGVTFLDVAGCDGSKQELTEVVDFLKEPAKYSALGAKIPKGVIMEGPPGTGKTLLARAVAGEAGVPFISASGSEFVEMFVGVGASRVRDLFGQAKKNAPCIVFIDEIDAIGRQRAGGAGGGMGGGGNDEREQTLNQILTEMDGFEGNTGVIVFAATNRADVLDNALVRPGRFDRRVPVDLPDVQGRSDILKVHVKGKPLAAELDLNVVAKRTTGFSGAGLANLMNEAAIVAARNGKTEIGYEEVDYALDRQTVGMQKTTGMNFPARQRLVAYHESGHAIMGLLTPDYDMVTKVTIIPRTSGAGGFTLFTPSEEQMESGMYTYKYLCNQLSVALGGRVAEEIVYGEDYITTGASNDLQQIRNIARRMVAQWGFANEELGYAPVAWETPDGSSIMTPRAASEETERQIDEQVKVLVKKAYDVTLATLTENRALLDGLCEKLIQEETVDYQELEKMRDEYNAKLVAPALATA